MMKNERIALTCDRCGKVIAYDEGLRLVFINFDTGEEVLIVDFAIKSGRCTHKEHDEKKCYARFSWYPSKRKTNGNGKSNISLASQRI